MRYTHTRGHQAGTDEGGWNLPTVRITGPTGRRIEHDGSTVRVLCNGDMHTVGTIAQRSNYIVTVKR